MKVTKHIEHLLGQGKKPKELIELGFSKRVITRVRRRLRKEKAASEGRVSEGIPQAEARLKTIPGTPESIATIWQKVQSMADELQRMDGLIQALSEVTTVVAAARDFGTYRLEACPHQKDGICSWNIWDSRDAIPQGIGEVVQSSDDETEWHIKPFPLYCAMCTALVEYYIDEVESKASESPLYGARYQITCDSCGSKGLIAIPVKCTKCGHQTYWGWHPKKKG